MRLVKDHNQKEFVLHYFVQVVAIHLVTFLVAPWLFTWPAFIFSFAAGMLFGYSLGIFHHMLLTHRSFATLAFLENFGSLLGTLTWRGPMAAPVRYVAMHKIHHAYTDKELDPHSPHHGIWHALLTWFWNMPHGFVRWEQYSQYAPELKDNQWLSWLDKNVDFLQLLWGALCFVGGSFWPLFSGGTPDWQNGVRYLVYGVFVRTFLSIYLMNAVDVINHTIGYRNYETKDTSTNSLMMFAIHLGGAISWHNNHHAHQHYFTVKRNWWEIDLHYMLLKGLRSVGLVRDIVVLDESSKPSIRMPSNWNDYDA